MHLLEDASQPQHVRNEEHLDQIPVAHVDLYSRSAIEDYGRDHVNGLNYTHAMLDWRGDGFTQLKDFWDRDFLRTGGASALNADLNGGASTLGLAEFCNGNFIGQRAVYGEFFPNHNDIHYFAFPSLSNTTQTNLKDGHLWETAIHGDVTLQSFKQGTRLYISKTGAGVPITFHSALSYLIAQHPGKSGGLPILTIADSNVLSNYHDVFIPKAVEYSAGLIDYFFRGTMNAVITNVDTSPPQFTVSFTNTSSQDFSGGSFYIFQDDSSGNRSLVAQTNLMDLVTGGTLATNNCATATFSGTLPTGKLTFLYQGTIGVSNGVPLDPADAGIAIAISPPPPIIVTANPLWTDSGLTVTNGETLGILASGIWTWGPSPGETGDANGVGSIINDLFLGGVNQGALIAYVGTYPPYDDSTGANRWGDSTYFPQSAGNGYWLVGKNGQITVDRNGELWFLINDDAVSKDIGDNSGFMNVTVFNLGN